MKRLLPIAIFLMMVSIGTSFQLSEMLANLRSMGRQAWWRLLLVVFLLPPILALVLARIFHLSLAETGGLFLIGVAPGAPLLAGMPQSAASTHSSLPATRLWLRCSRRS